MGKKSLLLVLMLVVAAWVLAGCGGGGGGVDTGALSGFAYMQIVTLSGDSARDGQPIVLSASPTPPEGYEPLFPGTVGGDAGSGVTYPNGSYFLGELPPGLYNLTFQRPDDPLSLSTYEVEVAKGLVTYGDDEETGDYQGDGYRLIDYFNPVVGKTWYYEPTLRVALPGFGFLRNEIIGDELGALGLWSEDDDGPCFGNVDGKLALLGLASREPGYLASLNPAVVFPENIKVGDTAQGVVTVTPVARSESRNGVTSMAFFWAFLGLEDITTPAGAYVGCLHFQMAFTAGTEVAPLDMTDVWFAQGVGPVAWTRAYQVMSTEYTIEALLLNSIVDESVSGPFTMLDYYPMRLDDIRGYTYDERSDGSRVVNPDVIERLVGVVRTAGTTAFAQAIAVGDEGYLNDSLMLMSNDTNGLRIYGNLTAFGGMWAVSSASNAITIPASVDVGDNDAGSLTLHSDTGQSLDVDYSWRVIGTAVAESSVAGEHTCLLLDLRLMPQGETGMRSIFYLADGYGPIVVEDFTQTAPGVDEWVWDGLRRLVTFQQGTLGLDTQPDDPAVYLQNAPGRAWSVKDLYGSLSYAQIYSDTTVGGSDARVEFSATEGQTAPDNEAYWFSNGLDGSLTFWGLRNQGDLDILVFDEPAVIPVGAELGDNWTYNVAVGVSVKVTVVGLFNEPWWCGVGGARQLGGPTSMALKLEVDEGASDFVNYWFLNEYTGMDRFLELEVGSEEMDYRYPSCEVYND